MILARRRFLFATPAIVAASSLMPSSLRALPVGEPSFDEMLRRILGQLAEGDRADSHARQMQAMTNTVKAKARFWKPEDFAYPSLVPPTWESPIFKLGTRADHG